MIVYQAQRKGCGFASVKMALCHASGRKDFAYAPERLIQGDAPSFAELMNYSAKMGLQLLAYQCEKSSLLENEEYPLLLSIQEDGLTHMVYLKKEDLMGRFVVYDPNRGKRVFAKEELVKLFDGRYMSLGEYRDIAPRFSKPKPLPSKTVFLSCLLSMSPIALLSLGILLLGYSGENMFVALPCFALSLISLSASRLFSTKQMERFDGRYLEMVDDDNLSAREEKFVHYHRYKAAALSSLSRLLVSFLEVAAALAFFAFRDPLLAFLMGTGLLVVTLEHLLDDEKEARRKEAVEKLEYRYVHHRIRQEERMAILTTLSKESSRYFRSLIFRETLIIASAIALSAIAISISSEQFALEQFLFYSLAISAVMSQGSSALGNYQGRQIKRQEEPYFALHFQKSNAE